MRMWVWFWLHSVGWGSGVAVSCGLGHRRGSDPMLLWLWWRLAAAAWIPPLAWELPCAVGAALKKKQNKQANNNNNKPSKIILDLYNVEMMSFAANTFGLHCTIYSRTVQAQFIEYSSSTTKYLFPNFSLSGLLIEGKDWRFYNHMWEKQVSRHILRCKNEWDITV